MVKVVFLNLHLLCLYSLVFCESIFPENDLDGDRPCKSQDPCVPINQCKSIVQLIKNSSILTQGVVNVLQTYHCGFEDKVVKICCPGAPVQALINRFKEIDREYHPNRKLLPLENCGSVLHSDLHSRRNNTDLFHYPWMALLSYKIANGIEFGCTGTIINKNYILTTASCLYGLKKNTTLIGVRVGDHDLTVTTDCQDYLDNSVCLPPPQDLPIEESLVHPGYNPQTNYNDIGLVRVAIPINFSNEDIQAICLPFGPNNFTKKTHGIVTGWGITGEDFISEKLLQFHVPIHSNEICREIFNDSCISDNNICAGGADNRDFCGGDIGSPLQQAFKMEKLTKVVQLGILSRKSKFCDRKEQPSVFTKVNKYTRWILDSIKP